MTEETKTDLPYGTISGMTLAPVHRDDPPAPPVEPPKAVLAFNFNEALATRNAAQEELHGLRNAVMAAAQATRQSKQRLQEEVAKFEAGGRRYTQDDASRDYRAASQAERLARAKRFGSGESWTARAYVQSRMQNGGNRGALNNRQRARLGFVVPGSPAAMAPANQTLVDARGRTGLTPTGKPPVK